jgi:hypothetical protein
MAVRVTRQIQNGSLYRYLLTTISVFTLATISIWLINADVAHSSSPSVSSVFHWLLVALMTAAICVVICRAYAYSGGMRPRHRWGSGARFSFLIYGAPDSGTHTIAGRDLDPDHRIGYPFAFAAACPAHKSNGGRQSL